MDVEFTHTLKSGRTLHVGAVVEESVEIVWLLTSDAPDAESVPLESLTPAEYLELEYWASQEYHARIAQWAEERVGA